MTENALYYSYSSWISTYYYYNNGTTTQNSRGNSVPSSTRVRGYSVSHSVEVANSSTQTGEPTLSIAPVTASVNYQSNTTFTATSSRNTVTTTTTITPESYTFNGITYYKQADDTWSTIDPGSYDRETTTSECPTSYTWSIESGASAYATFSSSENTATISYTNNYTANSSYTVTATAHYAGGAEVAGTATVTLLTPTVETPVITVGADGTITMTCATVGATIYYTQDGTTPTTSSTQYTAPFTLTGTNIINLKAIAVRTDWNNSLVAEARYPVSGINGTTVVLMDWEDIDNWTYYTGVDTSVDGGNYNSNYLGKLYSPDARNIIIEYRGGSVSGASAVAISSESGEGQNTMIYYQTMEKDRTNSNYPYTVIPNPFSKRPRSTSATGTTDGFYGFGGWKIISGGDNINGYSNNDVLPLDADITFTSSLTTGDHIILEATWVSATVKTGNSVPSFTGGTYETNFWVITNGNVSLSNALSQSMTITMYYPNNVKAENSTRSINSGFTVSNTFDGTVKFEYVNFNSTGNINAGGRNLYLGRGITNSNSNGHGYIYGCNTSSTTVNQTVRVESGKYQHFYHYAKAPSSITKQIVVFGCDYDRAKDDNTKLDITGVCKISSQLNFGLSNSSTMLTYTYSKSGKIMSSHDVSNANTADVYYFSPDGSQTSYSGGCRYLEIQGGEWCSIAGGFDYYHNTTDPAFTFRMKGGKLRGSIYGAGEFYSASGIRVFVITGGEVNGWVAGGANGTRETGGGVTDGTTYLYVGGNARIDSDGSTTKINNSVGGNVYGAGCGLSATSTSGEVTLGTNVVIADEAFVERGVYGGGGFGYCNTDKTATVYITSGTVNAGLGAYNGSAYDASIQGGVFGGASMNKGGSAQIYMTGGIVKHGIYGGSNMSGKLNGSTNIKVVGGNIGLSSSEQGHICGGGFGSDTRITNDVDVTIGGDATIYGEVYGGSEQGLVNTANNSDSYQSGKHVNVNVTGGTINGAVYGGGLGTSSNAANTYGVTKVTITGGTINGSVFGCNNVNGMPYDKDVEVEMTGGTVTNVYGGGNQAAYTGSTSVIIGGHATNTATVTGNVYGGGLGTTAVLQKSGGNYGETDVKVKRNAVVQGNVYGGGNGAAVEGNTNVTIGE